jgi:D-alanyl-D-alanine carboxypeptidase (penicillin-binding protein 5/6)
MTKELLKHKDYYNYTKIWLEDFKHPTGRLTTLTNTNKLIRFYADCDSGKTGYTSEALHCISASAVRGNMRLISVIIGGETSQKRFDDCKKLFNYAFANYENKEILNADAAIEAKLKVSGGLSGDIFVYPKTSYYIFSKKGEKPEVRLDYALPKSVKAPVKQGQTLGKIKIVKNNAVVAEVELVSREDVKRASIFHNFKKISRQFILANG